MPRPSLLIASAILLLLVPPPRAFTAAQPALVKDIAPGDESFLLDDPLSLKALGQRAIFAQYLRATEPGASDRAALWISDGTTAGTVKLREFSRLDGASMTVCGAQAFFLATGAGGTGLWRSDGTGAGTRQLAVLGAVEPDYPRPEIVAAGNLIYLTPVVAGRRTLWRSDGTAAGTWRVREQLFAGPSLAVAGGRVSFLAKQGDEGYALWQIPPGSGVPVLVRDLTPAAGDPSTAPYNFLSAGGILYFLRIDGTRPLLWRSDGTAAGTGPLDLHPPALFYRLMASGDRLILWGAEPDHGSEPWLSDGTAAGTRLLKDLHPGSPSSIPDHVVTSAGRAFIYTSPSDTGDELWASDGSAGGTVLLTTFAAHHYNIPEQHLGTSLIDAGGALCFVDVDPAHWDAGQQLWRSDGTPAGTRPLLDAAPAGVQVGLYPLLKAGSRLFFFAGDAVHGQELWSLELDPPTPAPVTPPAPAPPASAAPAHGCGHGSGIAALAAALLALALLRLRRPSAGRR